jgi:predicted TIM-barrel fold metal-dependent hydrolase
MAGYSGPMIDADVHNKWKDESEVYQYLPKPWLEYAQAWAAGRPPGVGDQSKEGAVRAVGIRPPNVTVGAMVGNAARLVSSFPADGSPPGSDYGMLKEQVLDKHRVWRTMLTHDLGEYGQHLNQYFGVELCRAANEWCMERWLPLDDRLYSAIVVPTSVPDEAAKEIRRLGAHPKLAAVLIAGNGLGRPFGDPIYHPIYEAAADMGLCLVCHVATDRPGPQITEVGGPASSGIVYSSQLGQSAMHYTSSLIVHGVFEKFPTLKIVFEEFGTSWLPSVIWGMDRQYDLLRHESPWVKKWPSEYFHDHIRVSTQPLEESPDPEGMIEVIRSVEGMEDMLCFSSDYPHMTFDDPSYIARLLPAEWHDKIFFENSCDLFGWQSDARAAFGLASSAVGGA